MSVNLRLAGLAVIDSTTFQANFNLKLSNTLTTSNVTIVANTPNIPSPSVLGVSVLGSVLTVTSNALTPDATYIVTFKSVDGFLFKSVNGEVLYEDDRTNVAFITGAADPDNSFRDLLVGYLKDSPYNLQSGTIARSAVNHQGDLLARAFYDIKQVKNENYISVQIDNEARVRGAGPYDRLSQEGAYEILRVGKNLPNYLLTGAQNYDSFPSSVITLQSVATSEVLTAGTDAGKFDKLVLNLSRPLITKVTSIVFQYQDGGVFTYDLSVFGYQLLESKYDQEHASPYALLANNQVKLSDTLLETTAAPKAGDRVLISYEYKHLGKNPDASSVAVSQILPAIRETAPAIITKFSTKHFPVTNAYDQIPTSAGIQFLDPEANPPFSTSHPAFANEIMYRLDSLPAAPGEYAVDYANGTVLVYGAVTGNGTGDYPPVMNYSYRKSFISNLDYTYDPEYLELVASPLRDLPGQEAKISFNYELVLVEGQDFKAEIHQEIIDERIENRLGSDLASLQVLHSPVTDATRVYNETTGEIYPVERFDDSKIYFTSSTPPKIQDATRERVSFLPVQDEVLILTEETVNAYSQRIYQVDLLNNNIIAATEDATGTSYNTSVNFSRNDLFVQEIYFDPYTSSSVTLDRLTIGDYTIDYLNGIVYVGVDNATTEDLGTINYKAPKISPVNPHLIAVSQVYYSLSTLSGVSKYNSYVNFGEGFITPSRLEATDERFYNGDTTLPYLVSSGVITVANDILAVRNIFDHYDLTHHISPLNFSSGATIDGNEIILDPLGLDQKSLEMVVTGSQIVLDFISAGIELQSVERIVRVSDGYEFHVASFSGMTINLDGYNAPVLGDQVTAEYHLKLNGGATPIVDYDRGDFYIDYTYLADEILVSYEYGDNRLDFRQSLALNEGDTYYVTYKIGALRTALLQNFGQLTDIPLLNNFDPEVPRERYRDALMGALQSFTKGPTIPSMKLLVKKISHIDPKIIETAFQSWTLGFSYLYPNQVEVTGNPSQMTGKFDYGMLLDRPGQSITLPASSNLKLDQGTFETWVIPEWDGLDNDARLTFSELKKDGYAIDSNQIWIGSTSFHPSESEFSVQRNDLPSPIGLPSAIYTSTGIFVYYEDHEKRWKVLAKDAIGVNSSVYSGRIVSSGEVYDVKFIPGLGELSDVLRSGTSKIDFEFHLDGYDVLSPDGYDGYLDGYQSGYSFDGIHFMADDLHYLLDLESDGPKNQFSLYKDGSGYLNFRVTDNREPIGEYKISADISSWKAGEKHHVGLAWRLNTSERKDEMHLFVDGFEVPNILKYGGRPSIATTDRFRTVKPEVIAGTVPLVTISGDDLHTEIGSTIVTSDSVNFSARGIMPGHTFLIRELGFSSYTVVSVSGKSLVLSASMPATLDDVRFSVNPYSVNVATNVDLFTNIIVSILHNGVESEIPGLRSELPSYSISKTLFNQNVLTLLGDAEAGDQIVLRTVGLNFRRARDRQYVWGNTSSILKTQLPPPINLDEIGVYAVILPSVSVGPSNSTFTLGNFVGVFSTTSVTNTTEGRTLNVRISSSNTNFSTPVTVQIQGTSSGPTSETLVFTSAGEQNTANQWKTISSVTVTAQPLNSSKDATSIEIKEAYSMIDSEGNSTYPIIRYSYKTQTGTKLAGDGSNVVTDALGYFTASNVGQKIVVKTPMSVAGTYSIVSRIDNNTITVSPTPAMSFTDGTYDVFNVSLGRSGFQNGFFTFEQAGLVNTPFVLPQGLYEFDYPAYLEVPMDPFGDQKLYIGSDSSGAHQAFAVLDETRILSTMLSDVRIGETLGVHEKSITTDYTAIREFTKDSDTLVLLHYNELPLVNSVDLYASYDQSYLQSDYSVNANFGKSLVVTSRPLILDNFGILNTSSEGTVEFWVSPKFDTYNDPNPRFYFDASGSTIESVTSITNGTVKISQRAGSVLSVRLASDVNNTGVDYLVGGRLLSDFETIQLGKSLPAQQSLVKVNYLPAGVSGDRFSIYKDREGFLNLTVTASGEDFQVRQPIFWSRDSWHRVRVTFKFNRKDQRDEIRLFVDGEERGTIRFGQGLLFGQDLVFGQGFAGVNNSVLIDDMNFRDNINQLYIGSDYLGANLAQARIDNLKISDISRSPLQVAGQNLDVNYQTNLETVYPAVEDAFTTYLMDFDKMVTKVDDFTLLVDRNFGNFNFEIDVIDSFGIVSGSSKVKNILETLIRTLKPAQSKVYIKYFA